jgi:UDP-N-acetylmuramoylalanine--D-glutamate ligase
MKVKNKRIVILGAARSGMAAASLLQQLGATPFVSDIASHEQKTKELKILQGLGIPFEFGEHSQKIFEADFVILSPGIPLNSSVTQEILKRGIPIYSEVEVASWFCKAQIIAITGSNGKTTTTTLLGEMLRSEIPNAIVAGNIGSPFSGQVIDSADSPWAAVEISSFQLETIDRFHPKVAIILNLAPNHLDWYTSYENYVQAKMRILTNLTKNDWVIFNSDDSLLSEKVQDCKAKRLRFSLTNNQAEAFTNNYAIFMHGQKLLALNQVLLKGSHNHMNAMAAGLAAYCANITFDSIFNVLTSFKGVEHRLEYVATIANVRFINDSKATTIESLNAALNSFDTPIILIAGGKDKGSDFSKVNDLIKHKTRDIILIGAAQHKIARFWQDLSTIHFAQSLSEAVKHAFSIAIKGDTVLLSPACSSFDMFKDFEDRGKKYKQFVHELELEYENQQA